MGLTPATHLKHRFAACQKLCYEGHKDGTRDRFCIRECRRCLFQAEKQINEYEKEIYWNVMSRCLYTKNRAPEDLDRIYAEEAACIDRMKGYIDKMQHKQSMAIENNFPADM